MGTPTPRMTSCFLDAVEFRALNRAIQQVRQLCRESGIPHTWETDRNTRRLVVREHTVYWAMRGSARAVAPWLVRYDSRMLSRGN